MTRVLRRLRIQSSRTRSGENTDCAVCAEPSQYDLPRIDCRIQHSDDRPDEVEYTITKATLRLCRTHLRAVLTEAPSDVQFTAAAVPQ